MKKATRAAIPARLRDRIAKQWEELLKPIDEEYLPKIASIVWFDFVDNPRFQTSGFFRTNLKESEWCDVPQQKIREYLKMVGYTDQMIDMRAKEEEDD